MTSHILLPQVDPGAPATFSRRVLTGLLREELGFGGVVVTDALDMAGASSPGGTPESAVRALAAGCDLLCLGNDTTPELLDAVVAAVQAAVEGGRLPAARLAEAVSRVRGLTTSAPLPEVPAGTTAEAVDRMLPPERVAAAFDLGPRAGAWRERAAGRFVAVRLEDRPNIAVGVLPWGPDLTGRPEVVLHPGDAVDLATLADGPVVVLGRDVHRHPDAREVVDRLRAERDVLVVDLGWPSPDRAYADVATFGASRLVGRALLAWLDG